MVAEPPMTKGKFTSTLGRSKRCKRLNGKFPINLKVMIEGEEEVGSVSLWDYVNKNKEQLKADALVVSDTAMLAKGVPSITYGLRGLNYYQIEIDRSRAGSALGNFRRRGAQSADDSLANYSRKLHDKNFRVAIPGFYDDVAKLSHAERKALNSLPWKMKEFARLLALRSYAAKRDSRLSSNFGFGPRLS